MTVPVTQEFCVCVGKSTADLILDGGRLNASPTPNAGQAKAARSHVVFNIGLKVLVNAIRQEKEVKDVEIGKGRILSSFSNGIIVYTENSKKNLQKSNWGSSCGATHEVTVSPEHSGAQCGTKRTAEGAGH